MITDKTATVLIRPKEKYDLKKKPEEIKPLIPDICLDLEHPTL